MKKKNNKGFSMVELLAVIVILGILATISIAAIQGIISRAKVKYYKTQENNMVNATRSYLEANKENYPKINGAMSYIYLNNLMDNKFIDQVKDYQKKNCDNKVSYVQVFKYNDDYMYTAYLKCPNYESSKDSNNSDFDPFTVTFDGSVKTAKATINIKDKTYGIVSYSYKIYKEGNLVFGSDNFDAKMSKNLITNSISIAKYVPGNIKITLTAMNSQGISKTKSFTSNNKYEDSDGPTCDSVRYASNTWTSSNRTIEVVCKDDGVGCVRNTYTKVFSTSTKRGTIEIEDTKHNKTTCEFDAYVDKDYPVVTLNFYKRAADGSKADNNVVATISTTTSSYNKTLNLPGLSNGWYSKSQYPNGFYLEAEYADISPVKNINWSINGSGLKSGDANASSITSAKSEEPNVESGKSNYYINEQGYRYGTLEVTDTVGHKSKITFSLYLDLDDPIAPTSYTFNISGPNSLSNLPAANGSSDSMSEFDKYLYCVKVNDSNAPANTDSCFKDSTQFTRSCGSTYYGYVIAVDKAGNRSGVTPLGTSSDAADSWSGWSGCTASCGGGTHYRTNTCALKTTQTEACNTHECNPVDQMPASLQYNGNCKLYGNTIYELKSCYSLSCGCVTKLRLHYCIYNVGGTLRIHGPDLSWFNKFKGSKPSFAYIHNKFDFYCVSPPRNANQLDANLFPGY